jgi:hypothetical protein
MSQKYISGLLCVKSNGRFSQKSKDGLLNAAVAIQKGLTELEKANNNDHHIFKRKLDDFLEDIYRLIESRNAVRSIGRIIDDGSDLDDIMICDQDNITPGWVLLYNNNNNVKNACKAVYEVMFCLHYYGEEECE